MTAIIWSLRDDDDPTFRADFVVTQPTRVGVVTSERRRKFTRDHIDACVPPIYYDGASPFYCDDGDGRYLKDASEP